MIDFRALCGANLVTRWSRSPQICSPEVWRGPCSLQLPRPRGNFRMLSTFICQRVNFGTLHVSGLAELTGGACDVPTQGPSWGYLKVNSQATLSSFGDKCPQTGSKNEPMAPRTNLGYPHIRPFVLRAPIPPADCTPPPSIWQRARKLS